MQPDSHAGTGRHHLDRVIGPEGPEEPVVERPGPGPRRRGRVGTDRDHLEAVAEIEVPRQDGPR